MPLPDSLDVALKEWDTACRLLAEGRQVVLLRKGGVSDENGVFSLKHRRFLLFPTFVHQRGELLQPWASDALRPADEEPAHLTIAAAAEIDLIHVVPDRAAAGRLLEVMCWNEKYLDVRYAYKPDRPLYAVLLRAHVLPTPARIENRDDYAGCVSWVPLAEPVATAGARPALDDAAFAAAREDVLARLVGG